MQNIINKYKLGFNAYVLEFCDLMEIRNREVFYMNLFMPELNLTVVVNSLISHTDETKKKLSMCRKGVPLKEEHIRNITKNHVQHRLGKPFTEVEKEKIRTSMPQSKKVIINNILYSSIKKASSELRIPRSTISNVLYGFTKRGHEKIKSFTFV